MTHHCDFCSSTKIVTAYRVPDFIMLKLGGTEQGSKGEWVACQECADLVDKKDIAGLSDRVLMAFEQNFTTLTLRAEERKIMAQQLMALYIDFFQLNPEKIPLNSVNFEE